MTGHLVIVDQRANNVDGFCSFSCLCTALCEEKDVRLKEKIIRWYLIIKFCDIYWILMTFGANLVKWSHPQVSLNGEYLVRKGWPGCSSPSCSPAGPHPRESENGWKYENNLRSVLCYIYYSFPSCHRWNTCLWSFSVLAVDRHQVEKVKKDIERVPVDLAETMMVMMVGTMMTMMMTMMMMTMMVLMPMMNCHLR